MSLQPKNHGRSRSNTCPPGFSPCSASSCGRPSPPIHKRLTHSLTSKNMITKKKNLRLLSSKERKHSLIRAQSAFNQKYITQHKGTLRISRGLNCVTIPNNQYLYMDVSSANFTRVWFPCNMTGWDLQDSIVCDSDLARSNLSNANLLNTIFVGCTFIGANFNNANVQNTQFYNCLFLDSNSVPSYNNTICFNKNCDFLLKDYSF
jgi:uncharacterized protein YjbI with pentapeptide repeats